MVLSTLWRGLLGRTYLMPVVIGVMSCAGLLFALIGDGPWDYLSWLALGIPVAIGLWFWLRKQERGNARVERA